MEIKIYKNASEIPKKYLPSLVDAQIECWGSKPFDEYMICENSNCRALYSIEDVHGSIEKYRERVDNIVDFECEECNTQVEQYYNKEEFLEEIREYIKGEVSTVLLINDEKVEGFGITSKTDIDGIVNIEFNTRPGSYNKKKLINTLVNNLSNQYLNCLHHIFISEQYRNKGYSNILLEKMFNFLGVNNYSSVLETRFDSKGYLIAKSMGFKEISNDKYGYILMYLKDKNFFSREVNESLNHIKVNFLKNKNILEKFLVNNFQGFKRKKYI